MQNFSKDEYGHQLPCCAACLHDFDQSQTPCPFPCRHLYCSQCLKRLQEAEDHYKCLYDGELVPISAVQSDLSLYNRIDYLKKFVLTRSDIAADVIQQIDLISKEVNFSQVPCPQLFNTRQCPFVRCPFDHSAASLAIARNFRDADCDSCWECKDCLLIVARRLPRCPVCEAEQTPSPQMISSPGPQLNRDVQKPTNGTIDLSTFEEKGESADGRQERTEKKNGRKPSSCCVLQ